MRYVSRPCDPLGRGDEAADGRKVVGTEHGRARSYLYSRDGGGHMSTPAGANTLSTDFDLMHSVAGMLDTRNEEIRVMLHAFIGRISGVPPSVWGGVAAARFKDVVDRWNAESTRLYHALRTIAETVRHNAGVLGEASQNHAQHIAAVEGRMS